MPITADIIKNLAPIVIFFVIIGFKIISAIIENSKKGGDVFGDDVFDDEASWESPDESVPPILPKKRASAKKATLKKKSVTASASARNWVDTEKKLQEFEAASANARNTELAEDISDEAMDEVLSMESLSNAFEQRQDAAYSIDSDDVPISIEEAFSLTSKRRSKKMQVDLTNRKRLREAIVTREIMARPRCFDV